MAALSLRVIIAARTNTLTAAILEEMCHVGIEDIYTPVNGRPGAHPLLPWLTPVDLEAVAGPNGQLTNWAGDEIVD
jgi:hypothetical protein